MKSASFAGFGAALLLSGCASTGVELQPVQPVFEPEVAQHVQRFSASPDGAGWVLAAQPTRQIPSGMADILDRIARARSSDDGQIAIRGSRTHQSPWSHGELQQLVKALEVYAGSGTFRTSDKQVANAFFDEVMDVFSDVGPAADAGLGLDAHLLDDMVPPLLDLERQLLDAHGS